MLTAGSPKAEPYDCSSRDANPGKHQGFALIRREVVILSKLTALGRPVVFSHSTNRLVVLLSLAVLAGILIYRLALADPFLEAMSAASASAFAFFLCWAISRELDPICEWSAFAGLPLTLVAAFILGPPALISLVFVLLLGRLINGSTGRRATPLDLAILLVLGTVLFNNGVLTGLPVLAAAFGIDAATASTGKNRAVAALLALALFALMLLFFYPGHDYDAGFNIYTGPAALAVVISTAILALRPGKTRVFDDTGAGPLDNRRILLARVVVAIFIVSELYLNGSAALVMFYPACFAYLGTAVYNLARRDNH